MQPTSSHLIFTASCVVVLALAGCASSGGESRDSLNSTIAIEYGTVTTVTPVKLKSNATRNATMGGLVGLLTQARGSGGQRLAGAAIGAAINALTRKVQVICDH